MENIRPKNKQEGLLPRPPKDHKFLYENVMPGSWPDNPLKLSVLPEKQGEIVQAKGERKRDALDFRKSLNKKDAQFILKESFAVACEALEQSFGQMGLPDETWSSFKRGLKKSILSVFKTIDKMDKKKLLCVALNAFVIASGVQAATISGYNCPESSVCDSLSIGNCSNPLNLTVHEVTNEDGTSVANRIRKGFNQTQDMALRFAPHGNPCNLSDIGFYLNGSDKAVNSDYSSPYFYPNDFGDDWLTLGQMVTAKLAYHVLDIPDQIYNNDNANVSLAAKYTVEAVSALVRNGDWPDPYLYQESNYTDPFVGAKFLRKVLNLQKSDDFIQKFQNGTITVEDVQQVFDQWPDYRNKTIEEQDKDDEEADHNVDRTFGIIIGGIAAFGVSFLILAACYSSWKKYKEHRDSSPEQYRRATANSERAMVNAAIIDSFLHFIGYRYIERQLPEWFENIQIKIAEWRENIQSKIMRIRDREEDQMELTNRNGLPDNQSEVSV